MDEFSDLPSQLEYWGDGTSIPDVDLPEEDSPDEEDSPSDEEETSKEVTTDYDSDEVLDDELKKIDNRKGLRKATAECINKDCFV